MLIVILFLINLIKNSAGFYFGNCLRNNNSQESKIIQSKKLLYEALLNAYCSCALCRILGFSNYRNIFFFLPYNINLHYNGYSSRNNILNSIWLFLFTSTLYFELLYFMLFVSYRFTFGICFLFFKWRGFHFTHISSIYFRKNLITDFSIFFSCFICCWLHFIKEILSFWRIYS